VHRTNNNSPRKGKTRAGKCVHKQQRKRNARAAAKAALLADALIDGLSKQAGQRDADKEKAAENQKPPEKGEEKRGADPYGRDEEVAADALFGRRISYSFRGDIGDVGWRDLAQALWTFLVWARIPHLLVILYFVHYVFLLWPTLGGPWTMLWLSRYIASVVVFCQLFPVGPLGLAVRLLHFLQQVAWTFWSRDPVRHLFYTSGQPVPDNLRLFFADGHYLDLRPDSSAVGEMKHGYPAIRAVTHCILFYGFPVHYSDIYPSLEIATQLATPNNVRLTASDHMTWERLQTAAHGLQSVNWNRYSMFDNAAIPQHSAILVYAYAKDAKERTERVPLPRTLL